MASDEIGFRFQPFVQNDKVSGLNERGRVPVQGASVQVLNLRPRFEVSGAKLPVPRPLLESPGGAGADFDSPLLQSALSRLFLPGGHDPLSNIVRGLTTTFSGQSVAPSASRGVAPAPRLPLPRIDLYDQQPQPMNPPQPVSGSVGTPPESRPAARGLFDDDGPRQGRRF